MFCSFQKDIFCFYCKWPVRLLWNTVRHKFHKAVFPLATAPVLDDSTVSQLCEMGFPLEACRKAVYYTGNTGIDSAMNWIMTHMEDSGVQNSAKLTGKKENTLPVRSAQPSRSSSLWLAADFAAPLVLPGCSSGPGTTPTESLSEDHLATIVSMGFSRDQATKALRATVRIQFSWFFSVFSAQQRRNTHWTDCVFVKLLSLKSIKLQSVASTWKTLALWLSVRPVIGRSWARSSARSHWKCNLKATQITW